MNTHQLRYSPEEFATKGSQLYRDLVLPKLSGDCDGKVVAITSRRGYANDIETGEFELADNTLAAAAKMFERLPDAQLWFERIGADAVHKFHSVRPAYL
jgi:hypothetical protein